MLTTRRPLMPGYVLYGSATRPAQQRRDEPVSAEPNRQTAFLLSGQIYVSDEPCAITTILGSCVAVCIWDSLRGIGGATHYLLPHRVRSDRASLRFGNLAIEQLIERLLDLGGLYRDLEAKVFGGACILEGFKNIDQQLGSKNVEVALQILEEERIPVITSDTGGSRGRKLVFNTDSGDAWVKLL